MPVGDREKDGPRDDWMDESSGDEPAEKVAELDIGDAIGIEAKTLQIRTEQIDEDVIT